MQFFPYDPRALRCHPMSAFVCTKQKINKYLTIDSNEKLVFRCSVCSMQYTRTPNKARHESLICKVHSRTMYEKLTDKYNGPIPYHVSHPIRAGLLLGVNRDHLLNLIKSLDPVKHTPNPTTMAKQYIDTIARYDRALLADNCFWGPSSPPRSRGVCSKQPPKGGGAVPMDRSTFFSRRQRDRRTSDIDGATHSSASDGLDRETTGSGVSPPADATSMHEERETDKTAI
jgi:hypothetical protein